MAEASNFQTVGHHGEYYLVGGDLHFLIERHYFRVHRYFFDRESTYFRNKLMAPVSPGQAAPGSSDSNAVVLDDVKSSDFARFLWVFYNPKYSLYDTTVEDWTSILALAHRWKFPEVKALAVRELEKLEMTDIDRVVTYHQYDVDRNLLIPRYAALCAREEPLSLPEGLRLGMETTLMLARAREVARSKPAESGTRSPVPADLEQDTMYTIIKELFDIKPTPNSPTSPRPTTPVSTSPFQTGTYGSIAERLDPQTPTKSGKNGGSLSGSNGAEDVAVNTPISATATNGNGNAASNGNPNDGGAGRGFGKGNRNKNNRNG